MASVIPDQIDLKYILDGVPIESVSKMLGLTNIWTTQHYAKILDIKLSEDMKLLKQKLIKSSESTFLAIPSTIFY